MWEEEGGERDTVTNPHLTKVCRQGGKDLDIFSARHFLCNYSFRFHKDINNNISAMGVLSGVFHLLTPKSRILQINNREDFSKRPIHQNTAQILIQK